MQHHPWWGRPMRGLRHDDVHLARRSQHGQPDLARGGEVRQDAPDGSGRCTWLGELGQAIQAAAPADDVASSHGFAHRVPRTEGAQLLPRRPPFEHAQDTNGITTSPHDRIVSAGTDRRPATGTAEPIPELPSEHRPQTTSERSAVPVAIMTQRATGMPPERQRPRRRHRQTRRHGHRRTQLGTLSVSTRTGDVRDFGGARGGRGDVRAMAGPTGRSGVTRFEMRSGG